MTIRRPVNVSSLDHDLEMEALFPIETVLCIFHKCDVCILHRIRSRKTMQLSFAPAWRAKTSIELLGGDDFEIFRTGIGEHGQTVQTGRTLRTSLTILYCYVDGLNLTHCPVFKPDQRRDRDYPGQLACLPIDIWHTYYEQHRTQEAPVHT